MAFNGLVIQIPCKKNGFEIQLNSSEKIGINQKQQVPSEFVSVGEIGERLEGSKQNAGHGEHSNRRVRRVGHLNSV